MSNTYAVCHTCDGEGDLEPTDLSARQRKRLAHSGKAPQRQPCIECAGRGVLPVWARRFFCLVLSSVGATSPSPSQVRQTT